jgi:mono/diheme cytochrome c family protein
MKICLSFGLVLLLPALVRTGEPVDYTSQIKPIFTQHCISCHGPDKQRASLRLDCASGILQGGNSGPALVAGKSADSLLLKAVTAGAEGDIKPMPPKGPRLTPEQVALLRAWIDEGAKFPASETVGGPRGSKHWSFQPITRPALPAIRNPQSAIRNPIDRFILAELEKKGIAPSPEADRVTLIRRLSLDLIGLPPTPAEVDAFVKDTAPDAYERLVDRLLVSPHYGERWGRHWLDLARYADSNGYSIDAPRSIWKYRDWVIDALNRDMPFDRFTTEQIAGDLLPSATLDQKIATGFHRNTQINQEGGIDVEQFRVESIVDRVNTTGSVWLGITIGCCQCHDHKFDPLPMRDYYSMFAFFNSVDEPTLELASPDQLKKKKELQTRITALEKKLKAIDSATAERVEKWEEGLRGEARKSLPPEVQAVLALPPNGRSVEQQQVVIDAYRNMDQARHVAASFGTPGAYATGLAAAAQLTVLSQRRALAAEIAALSAQVPQTVSTLIVQERTTPRPTNIHLAGDFTRKGAVVRPQTPEVLPPLEVKGVANRLDLANWIVDPRNPLTARVLVNRLWERYFGLGIVETENDFGTQGTPPSHPELLDWLASEMIAQRWSLKAMHRLIVTSATYRQSSKARPDLQTIDPRNRLLSRQNRVRLEAEVVRDVALATSGLLNPAIGGPSVFPPQPDGVYKFTQVPKNWKTSTGPDRFRRGLYTWIWRSLPHPGLTVFDAPDGVVACTRRNRSNTPLQALTLLNDQAALEFAQGLAARILQGGADDESRIRHAFRVCVAREPSAREQQVLLRLVAGQRQSFANRPDDAKLVTPSVLPRGTDVKELAAWTMAARALLNIDEFITRE